MLKRNTVTDYAAVRVARYICVYSKALIQLFVVLYSSWFAPHFVPLWFSTFATSFFTSLLHSMLSMHICIIYQSMLCRYSFNFRYMTHFAYINKSKNWFVYWSFFVESFVPFVHILCVYFDSNWQIMGTVENTIQPAKWVGGWLMDPWKTAYCFSSSFFWKKRKFQRLRDTRDLKKKIIWDLAEDFSTPDPRKREFRN